MLLRNPKTGEELETDMTEHEAEKILKENLKDNDFAQSLLSKKPNLSAAQWFWFFKLAHEYKNRGIVELASNLEEFIKPFGLLQFKVGDINISPNPMVEKLKTLGKIRFYANSDKINVMSGQRFCGEIRGNEFIPTIKCPDIIKIQIRVFAEAPVEFLELFGKLTGSCCICGRTLTNEESVIRGIGPICAERFGI